MFYPVMSTRRVVQILFLSIAACLIGALFLSGRADAGVTVYEDGDRYLEVGGRIQVQYNREDPDDGEEEDDIFFRRLRPYIEGSTHKDWKGKFQWEMGRATGDNEISVRDAYFQYLGVENMKFTIGNAHVPFSREGLTSSKRQQLVERTFVGSSSYGTPDRQLGIHVTGSTMEKKLTYGVSAASASFDPDADRLDFETPVNDASDYNEGWILGGRVDFHPLGYLRFAQGDFKRTPLATIGVAAFTWHNDDDNNTRTSGGIATDTSKPDVDSVTGFEVSTALRFQGLSVDLQYNMFDAETVDPTVTSGLFQSGDAELTNWAAEAGYMIVPDRFEIVAGYESQDADTYEEEWTRASLGANYFIKKHDIKIQATYRMGENLDGVKDSDEDEFFVQLQYVF
ncbi:MAG: OprO/OprP family phosphate-selective porin [Desulfobacterales bacterium]|nr:OprO/OprP family phosphate-selective porin [Desulfobacterales bacterium]